MKENFFRRGKRQRVLDGFNNAKGNEVKRRKEDEKDDAMELIQSTRSTTSQPNQNQHQSTPINTNPHPNPPIAATANTNRGTSSLVPQYKYRTPLIRGGILILSHEFRTRKVFG